MTEQKKLSNPFSTGGGGYLFEAHVQATFVTLMLTGGYAPCLPCWPITEIKLQGKIDGYDTDDLIVTVQSEDSQERRKLLGQVKSSIAFTAGDRQFSEVLHAAWSDFNNPEVFTKGKDAIALITGPLSASDTHNVQWLLNQAKCTENVDEFFRYAEQAIFSPPKSAEKLEAIQCHLKAANNGADVSKDELYDFLKHFYLLGYDLGNETGVVLPLLHSHISQIQRQNPKWIWSRVVEIVQERNQHAGIITIDNIPADLQDLLKRKSVIEIPEDFKLNQSGSKTDWAHHPDAAFLALATLIGSWQDGSQCDLEVVSKLLGVSYKEWLIRAQEILQCPDSPLYVKNGSWKVVNRAEVWGLLGSRVLDNNLEVFRSLAIDVLKEPDPSFELPAEDRYMASILGKDPKYSRILREGISEGLAILGTQSGVCSNCSQDKIEGTCILVIRELLENADWILWGSLNSVLPNLAEAAPDEFIGSVEKALQLSPCPFDELFSQESSGIVGRNYLTGLLWALEGLAWDEQYLVRACVALGELARHDLGGQWANRPANSLETILLPWMPQTLATVDKRKVALETTFDECPDVAWNLIIQLLPSHHQSTSGSFRPRWRKIIPDDCEKGATPQEYWSQVSFYAEFAVTVAGQDVTRLSELIDHLDSLPKHAFDQLLQTLSSQPITEFPEEQRLSIWNHLTKFTNKHRRFHDAEWALSDEPLSRIEQIAKQLAPTNPFNLYQHIFTDRDFDLYEENDDFQEQRKKLDALRETAVVEVLQQEGVEGVIRFAKSVSSPNQVGCALGAVVDSTIERALLPNFLDMPDDKCRALVEGFIWRRFYLKGWDWCAEIDKSDWTPEQIGIFLTCLPFAKEVWERASEWLQSSESEYWTRTYANPYQTDDDFAIAVEKLIKHGRPRAAISCLDKMRHIKQTVDVAQCIRALLEALSSNEPSYLIREHEIVEMIKFLQTEPSVDKDDLFRIEWAYLPLLNHHGEATPQLLEDRLANNPEFFCELIQLAYKSRKGDRPEKESTEETAAIAANAWRLLHVWKTPPGTQKDGTFIDECFNKWLQSVIATCTQSGHLEVALSTVGNVLVYSPPDTDGLWICRAVASALNDRDAENLRGGFNTGMFNSRGVHFVDPTGKSENELAEQFRNKADAVENAGFHRFAVTLRELARSYNREANRIVNQQMDEDSL